jgi:type I restriction enzyme, S subunit
MTLTHFADVVSLSTSRLADPAAAGIERFVGLEHIEPENLHIRNWGLVADGTTFTSHFKPGQVLFGKRRAYQRKVAVADFEGVCSGDIYIFESKDPKVLLPELLPFICQSEGFYEYAVKTSAGSLSPRTNWSHLANFEFPLPPLDEQRRIADLLWAADDVVEKNQEVVQRLSVIQKWHFESWLTDGNMNAGWIEVKLSDVCDIQNGQIDPKESPYCDMVHIASDDIESGTGGILEMNTAAQDQVISGNYLFTEKAIVYSKIRPNLKKVVFPKFSGVCSADVYPIYPRENILPDLLFQLLLSETFTQYAISQSARSAIPKINRDGLLAFKFRLPPLRVQEKIAEILNDIFQSLELAKQHVQNSKILKRELLQKTLAFQRIG